MGAVEVSQSIEQCIIRSVASRALTVTQILGFRGGVVELLRSSLDASSLCCGNRAYGSKVARWQGGKVGDEFQILIAE